MTPRSIRDAEHALTIRAEDEELRRLSVKCRMQMVRDAAIQRAVEDAQRLEKEGKSEEARKAYRLIQELRKGDP